MPVALDLTNQRFGRLRALRKHPLRNEHGKTLWECLCDPELEGCGKTILAQSSHLSAGNTKSCGCFQVEVTKATNTKHGYCAHPEYKVWNTIKLRCYDPKSPSYKDYGARGITMSDAWKESFDIFLADMGSRPSKNHSIERDNNDLGYSKENCRWATRREQANNRRSNRYFTFDGERKTLADWCREFDLEYAVVWGFIYHGKSFEDAVNTALQRKTA